MRLISDTNRSDSTSETSGEDGDIAEAFTGKDIYQELISHANSVPILKVFRQYHINLDPQNRKITCPFKSHKGGRETTPSFYYYPETNSYHCFGCRNGSRAVDFVAIMEHCTKEAAAKKILNLFGADVDEDSIYDQIDFAERLNIMMDFSNDVREFHQKFPTEHARLYVEAACKKYDALNLKKNLNNEALRRIVEQLKEYITLYKP